MPPVSTEGAKVTAKTFCRNKLMKSFPSPENNSDVKNCHEESRDCDNIVQTHQFLMKTLLKENL